jgi:signal transduction histidine kinase
MLKHHEKEMSEECRSYLEQIRINARRIEVLASDLTTLLRIGSVALTPKKVSSLEVVKNTAMALREKLDAKQIEFVMADDLPNICCDEEKIYQVFDNLLSNAVKFVQATKHPKIEISWKDKGAFHQFSVSDNGIGIDPKYHREIFGKFKRLREMKDEHGTGLGLAIVDRIVKNHGGTVSVESEKGKGATFYFTLPKAS